MTRTGVPRVIAHRGASRDRPENTVAAFDEALAQGADGIELDVQLSRDGVAVVWHDRTLARAGAGRRRVASLRLDELRALRFAGEPLPTLAEVLERYAGRVTPLVELKTRLGSGGRAGHRRLADAVAGELRAARLLRRSWVLSFDRGLLEHLRTVEPRARTVLNLRPPARGPRTPERSFAGLDALSADVGRLAPRWAAAVRASGRPLFCYTVNDRRRLARALAAGVDGIMSDRPGWLRRTLAAGAD